MAETTNKKPTCELVGQGGNIFNLVGIASKALKKAGQADKVTEMQSRVLKSGSYDNALAIICEYVDAE